MHRGESDEAETIHYDRDIRPILSERCFTCHGPDAKQAPGEAAARPARGRGRGREGARGDRARRCRGKRAVAPHQQRTIRTSTMPPPESNKRRARPRRSASSCAAGSRAARRTSRTGRSSRPHGRHCRSRAGARPKDGRQPDRRFVLARARERSTLAPSPPAERETLLRRLFLDLTGLPPTPEEIDAFLADDAARRIRAMGRSTAHRGAVPQPLRRAHGDALARRGALRRHVRHPHRRRPADLAVARLGAARVPREHALRSLPDRAIGGRSPARSHRGPARRERFQSQPHHHRRGRRDRRGVHRRVRGRSHRDDGCRVPWPDPGMRPLPRPQVRPASPRTSSTSSTRSSIPSRSRGSTRSSPIPSAHSSRS